MTKDKKKQLKLSKKDVRKNFCLRLLDEERVEMQKLADEFCGGSLSDWLRAAGVRWKPDDSDLE